FLHAQPRKAKAFYVATPLGFEPRITPPKGAVLPLHHGVIGWPTYDSRRRNGSCNSGGTNNSRFCRQRSPLDDVRQPGAVALQSKSGTRCYSRGLGRRMSIVVPLP